MILGQNRTVALAPLVDIALQKVHKKQTGASGLGTYFPPRAGRALFG
jgi:hypothetical protein